MTQQIEVVPVTDEDAYAAPEVVRLGTISDLTQGTVTPTIQTDALSVQIN